MAAEIAPFAPFRPCNDDLDPYAREDSKRLPFLDIAAWEGVSAPQQQWVLEQWLPEGQATYLTGPGSAGKSLLGQQLATAVALGVPFMGVPTVGCPTLYITCEDGGDALHLRQEGICRALNTSPASLDGKLFLASLAGKVGNELATFHKQGEPDEFGRVEPTIQASALFRAIERRAIGNDVGLIVLDNVAHFFAGNENIRNEVAAFMALLNGLAMRISGAVLLIGHPNKAGDSFSGSTAWENQVRSRLFLESVKEEDGSVLDRDARVLRREKSNYARNGAELHFRWHDWAFVREDDLPDSERHNLTDTLQASADNETFLRCLDERNRQERPVSESPASRTYAPRIFADMAESKRIGRARLEAAMDRLFRVGAIERGFIYRDRSEGKDRHGLRPASADLSADVPLTPSADVPLTTRRPPPAHTPYTTYNPGAAVGQAAPDDEDIDWGDQDEREP